jgi:hypothetical protein
MTAQDHFPLNPIAHAVAIAYDKFEAKPQIPTFFELLERRKHYAKSTWTLH